jgi:glycosyltransferase involved in cell wall biosynthesis
MTLGSATFTADEIAEFVRCRAAAPIEQHRPSTQISVVLTSYNQVAFLERTMNSIANQNYAALELIVMDGGSSDGSQDIIGQYRDIISHYESGRDGGQAAAINKGFAIATGDFIAWQNSDDLYLSGFLRAVDEAVRAYAETDLLIANSYVIDAEDRILWGTKFGPFSWEYLARVGWNLTSQSVFVRRDLAREAGPLPNYRVAFDFEWFLRVTAAARSILQLKRYGGAYRIHPASKLSTVGMEERDPLEKRILSELGLRIDPTRTCAEQWPMRRRLLVARQRLHELMLYPHRRMPAPCARAVSRTWASLLNANGARLVGY